MFLVLVNYINLTL